LSSAFKCGSCTLPWIVAHNPLLNYHEGCEPQPLEIIDTKMYSKTSSCKFQFNGVPIQQTSNRCNRPNRKISSKNCKY